MQSEEEKRRSSAADIRQQQPLQLREGEKQRNKRKSSPASPLPSSPGQLRWSGRGTTHWEYGVASLCARARQEGGWFFLSFQVLVWKCFACNFSSLLLLGCSAVTDYWPICQKTGPLACSGLVAKATEATRCGWWVLSSINGLIRRGSLAVVGQAQAGACLSKGPGSGVQASALVIERGRSDTNGRCDMCKMMRCEPHGRRERQRTGCNIAAGTGRSFQFFSVSSSCSLSPSFVPLPFLSFPRQFKLGRSKLLHNQRQCDLPT